MSDPTLEETKKPIAVTNHSRHPVFTDREMWVAIRGYLLGVVTAIDRSQEQTPLVVAIRAALLGIAKAIELRWNLNPKKLN